jgi:hypothetical protein
MSRLPSTPISIIPSPAELKNGRLDQRNLEIAVRAIARDGLVVLEDLVDHATLDRLNVKMVEDAYELQGRKDSPFNYNKGNIQQDPPMTGEWFSESIYTSKPNLSCSPFSQRINLHVLMVLRPHSHSSLFDRAWAQSLVALRIRQYCSTSN